MKALPALEDFLGEIWIVCPRCTSPALVVATGRAQMTCASCGHIEVLDSIRSKLIGVQVDPYFKQPLWFQAECCREVLWAYNPSHLAFLKEFVCAKLRDTGPPGDRNLGNKLPKWMLLAANRDEVLKAIERLEERLANLQPTQRQPRRRT